MTHKFDYLLHVCAKTTQLRILVYLQTNERYWVVEFMITVKVTINSKVGLHSKLHDGARDMKHI